MTLKKILKTIFILSLLTTASCITPYRQKTYFNGGGYSEAQLDQNNYIVSYYINGNTPLINSVDFALLRSSQIAIKNEKKNFSIKTKNLKSSVVVNHYTKCELSREYSIAELELSLESLQKPDYIAFESSAICNAIIKKYPAKIIEESIYCDSSDEKKEKIALNNLPKIYSKLNNQKPAIPCKLNSNGREVREIIF